MRYEEIKELIEKYGENYLNDSTIERIIKILPGSKSMREELESIPEEWLARVKELKKIYVYTDSIYRKDIPEERKRKGMEFPYLQTGFQDEYDWEKNEIKAKIPHLKWMIERKLERDTIEDRFEPREK